MDLEKYVRACERASLDNTRLKEIFAKTRFPREVRERKEKVKRRLQDKALCLLRSFFTFCFFSQIKLVRSSSQISNQFCFSHFAKWEQILVFTKQEEILAKISLGRKRWPQTSQSEKESPNFLFESKYMSLDFPAFRFTQLVFIHGPNLFKVCKKCFSSVCPGNQSPT